MVTFHDINSDVVLENLHSFGYWGETLIDEAKPQGGKHRPQLLREIVGSIAGRTTHSYKEEKTWDQQGFKANFGG
jgi:hypothetical protein